MKPRNTTKQFAVIGLGRFGMSIVQTLATYNVNILACDRNPDRLHRATEYATHVVQADAADEDALDKLGLGNFDVVLLTMGGDFESALIATRKAKELGVACVVAKAYGIRQKQIFESVGADIVVLPEQEMGAKLASRLMRPNILDILENSDQRYKIAEMHPMEEWVNRTVREADIRRKHGITLLAILRDDKTIIPVLPEQQIQANDVLVTLARPEKL